MQDKGVGCMKRVGCAQEIGHVQGNRLCAMKMSLGGNRVREGEGREGEERGGKERERWVGEERGQEEGRGREWRGKSQEKSIKERGECVKSRVSRG